MSVLTKKHLKTVDIPSLKKKKEEAEKEFNALREEAIARQEEWKRYSQETNTKLIQLQGAFQALNSLLSDVEKAKK